MFSCFTYMIASPHQIQKNMDKLDQDFEEWTPLLLHLLESNRLKAENELLRNQIKHLESQVYGGTTK